MSTPAVSAGAALEKCVNGTQVNEIRAILMDVATDEMQLETFVEDGNVLELFSICDVSFIDQAQDALDAFEFCACGAQGSQVVEITAKISSDEVIVRVFNASGGQVRQVTVGSMLVDSTISVDLRGELVGEYSFYITTASSNYSYRMTVR